MYGSVQRLYLDQILLAESRRRTSPSLWLQAESTPEALPPVQATRVGEEYRILQGQAVVQAAILANLDSVPAIILQESGAPRPASELRYATDPISEAEALAILKESHALSDRELAERLGWSRKQVADLRRLLNLDPEVQEQVREGRLSAAKAAELVSIPPARQRSIAEHAVLLNWSLADIRAQAQRWKRRRMMPDRAGEIEAKTTFTGSGEGEGNAASTYDDSATDPDLRRLEQQLEERLGCTVRLRHTAGELVIRYGDMNVLEGVLAHLISEDF